MSSQEHQRQTTQPCQRARFPFTRRTPFSLSKVWCIQARPDLCNDWSKKSNSDSLLSISDIKRQDFQRAFSFLFRSKRHRHPLQGHISFRWSESKQKSTERKQRWLIEWRTMMGPGDNDTTQPESLWQLQRRCIWAEEKGEWGKEEGLWGVGLDGRGGTDWLAVSWGACFACRERSREGTGVTRCEGKALSSAPGP